MRPARDGETPSPADPSAHPGGRDRNGRIAVFTWRLESRPDATDRQSALLSPDELARRDRFHDPRHRARFASGRTELRRILAAEIGAEPGGLRFRYNANGKPELAEAGPLQFNLSHSDDVAVLALSRTHRVGVDVEVQRPFLDDVAGTFFTRDECAALALLPETQRQAGFYRCWTRKEAIVKAIGGGLAIPLDSFCVSLDDAASARLVWIDPAYGDVRHWSLHHLDVAPGCVG